ncbi:MAG: 30S ribosomal protein S16, partial [Balneolaceae bacterium]
ETAEEDVKAEEADAETDDSEKEAGETAQVSSDMNANEAIEHIRNTPLEKLEGFVTDDEDRVTVQRAWKSKQSE